MRGGFGGEGKRSDAGGRDQVSFRIKEVKAQVINKMIRISSLSTIRAALKELPDSSLNILLGIGSVGAS